MSLLSEILPFVLSYIIVLLIGFFLMQFLSNGYFTIFMKIKASRGKKILVEVKSKLQHYYTTGFVEGSYLIYVDREAKREKGKLEKRVVMPKDFNPFYRKMNVNCVNVDEEKNCIYNPADGKGVAGYDAIKWGNLLKRALMNVKIKDDGKIIIIILIVVILLVLGLIAVLAQISSLSQNVTALQQSLQGLSQITGGERMITIAFKSDADSKIADFVKETRQRFNNSDMAKNPFVLLSSGLKKRDREYYAVFTYKSIYPNLSYLAFLSLGLGVLSVVMQWSIIVTILASLVTIIFGVMGILHTGWFHFKIVEKALRERYDYQGMLQRVNPIKASMEVYTDEPV